mmetsp:Transcript_4230/g.7461  ORF Transcript_4230/g.7461 Transcript_4230/m.7461 type:complete len:280 (-) Transcript_4230:51-890(-)
MFSPCACWTPQTKDAENGEEAPTVIPDDDLRGPVEPSVELKSPEKSSPLKAPEEIPLEKSSEFITPSEEGEQEKEKSGRTPSKESIAEKSSQAPSKESVAEKTDRAPSKESVGSKKSSRNSRTSRSSRSSVKISADGGISIHQSEEEFRVGEQLVKSAEAGDLGTIRSLLEQRAAVESMDKEGRTVLRTAAKKGHVDLCRPLLLEFGADIDGRNPYNGYTSLHWACKFDRGETIKLLMSYGADTSLRDKEGLLPLELIQKRNPKMAEWMTSMGASTGAV